VVAKRSARSVKIKTLNQIRHLSYTAPEQLRQRLKDVSRQQLAARAAALRPGQREGANPVMTATKTALRLSGRRMLALDEEKARIDVLLSALVTQTAPDLLTLHGVGIDTAATLLVTASDNPSRLRSEAAWAHLCGTTEVVSPVIMYNFGWKVLDFALCSTLASSKSLIAACRPSNVAPPASTPSKMLALPPLARKA